MGTVTVREVLWAVSGLLNDSAPQYARFVESNLVGYLGDGELALAKYLPTSVARTDAVRLLPGSLQSIAAVPTARIKPGDGSAAADVIGMEVFGLVCNMGADGLTPGRAIRPCERSILDDLDPDWHWKTPALVVKALVSDPRIPLAFMVHPPVGSAADVWVRMQWAVQPAKLPNTGTPGAPLYAFAGSNAQKLTVADEFKEDLVNYVCARVMQTNSQSADSQSKFTMFSGAFLNSINLKVQALTGTNPNLKRLPMAPNNLGTAS